MSLSYSGQRRDGVSTYGVGREAESAAEIARRLFDARFRRAEIKNDRNEIVGVVGRNDLGVRIWWGEE